MANVYLQVPTYYAAYIRNSYTPVLQKGEPIKFSEYSIERAYMRVGLVPITGHKEKSPISYSEREWKNMMEGRHPNGGPIIRKRDKTEYLTYAEIRELSGAPLKVKSDNYEYLCIQMPTVVIIEGKQCRTNAVYNLDHETAMLLRSLFQEEFMTRLKIFMLAAHHYNFREIASSKRGAHTIIDQKIINTIERFLLCYDIPVSSDYQEFKTIRKMVQRHIPNIGLFLTPKEIEHITFKDAADRIVDVNSERCKQMLIKELNKIKK